MAGFDFDFRLLMVFGLRFGVCQLSVLQRNPDQTMTIAQYGHIGTITVVLGVAILIASVVLFVIGGSGISLGSPESSLDSAGTLHFHDTYYILLSTGHRLILLLPLLAGIVLITTGTLIRRQIPSITSTIQQIEDAEQVGDGDAEEAF